MLLSIKADGAQAEQQINRVSTAANQLTSATARGGLNAFAYSQAFETVGRGMFRAGLAITAGLGAATKAANDFGHEMALANTQAQLSTEGLERLSNQALEVSDKYGVAATDIGRSLYDIFSTTDQTAKEAIRSVDVLAKASVTGATDISAVTRGVVDIQNAFGKAAGNTNRILNVQFQTLRNSAGTYDELVDAFGNLIGAAKQTDQSIESAAGAMAFLTLRGRSQAEASVSVSRALDQITRSAVDIKKVLGVAVYDAQGNFRALEDIINDMGVAMQDMTSQQQAQAFEKMFGAGSIQANRFFRTAIPGFEQLNDSVAEVSSAGGELNKQFKIMQEQDPSYVFNRLQTQLTNVGIRLARELLPDMLKVIDFLRDMVKWFNELDPSTQKWIARLTALAGIFALVGGKALMMAGAVLRIISTFRLAGIIGKAATAITSVGTASTKTTRLMSRDWSGIRQTLGPVPGDFRRVDGAMAGVSRQTAKWRTALHSLGGVLASLGIAVFIAGVSKAIQTIREADAAADEWFKGIENGKRTFDDMGVKVDNLQTKVDDFNDFSLGDQFRSLFTGEFWEAQGAEHEIERLNDRMEEHKDILQANYMAMLDVTGESAVWAGALTKNTDLSQKQRDVLANNLRLLGEMGLELTDAQRFTALAAIEAGNYAEALRILQGVISGVTGALKNLASSAERTNDKVEIYNQKQERSEHLTRRTSEAVRDNDRAMRDAEGGAERAAQGMNKWGGAAEGAGKKVDDATGKANRYVSGSPYSADIKANDQASSVINAVARAAQVLNGTRAYVTIIANREGFFGGDAAGAIRMAKGGFITQGPTFRTARGQFGRRLAGEGTSPTFAGRGAEAVIPFDQRGIGILAEAVRRGTDASSQGNTYNIDVHPEHATIDAKELVRELEWERRTRGWN